MIDKYDTIVIGVGSMGAATCYELARRRQRVLGIDQFSPPHERGSHAGQSRIIRKAYFEHPDYVPLLERAYEHWADFEAKTGTRLFHKTGIVYFGKADNENIAGVRKSADLYKIPIENIPRQESSSRLPQFQIPDDFDTVFEPDAGFVTPEAALTLYISEAEKAGASIVRNTTALGWKHDGDNIRVSTSNGEYIATRLVVTAGAWTSRILQGLSIPLEVTRQHLAWFAPSDNAPFLEDVFPCWFVEDPELGTFYGFPWRTSADGPVGVKLAHHHPGVRCSPEDMNVASPDEEDKLRQFVRRYIPSLGQNLAYTKQCLYTYSPDSHFIIDFLPGSDEKVCIACGFSGHGFKFAPVVGEILADFVTRGKTDLPVGFLGVDRLAGS